MAIKGALSDYYGSQENTDYGEFFGGFAERRRKQQEAVQKQEKLSQYGQRFTKSLYGDTQKRILDSLKKRADAGDQTAAERYNAIVNTQGFGTVQQTPSTPQLSLPQRLATGAAGVAGAVTEFPREALRRGTRLVERAVTDERRGPGAAEIMRRQEQAKRVLPEDIQRSRSGLLQEDSLALLDMVNRGSSAQEIRTFFDEAKQRKAEADRRVLGASLEAGSLVAGGGSLVQAARRGAAPLARAVAGTTASGAAGGAGYTLRTDPNATARELATSAAVGAGAGLVAGAVPGAARKVRETVDNIPSIAETRLGAKVAQTRTAKRINDLRDRFVAKVVDDTNYIKKPFRGVVNEETGQRVTDEIETLVTNVRQFAAKAQDRLQTNQAFQELRPLIAGNKDRYKQFGSFINRKQDAINRNKLIDAGRIEGAKVQVPVGTAEEEAAYQLLNRATKDDIQYLFDNGIIEETKYRQWMDDPDYTRVQREIEDELTSRPGGSGLVSGSPVAGQKLKGSTKRALDPFAAYEDWQRRVTLDVERNNLSKYLRDQGLKRGVSNQVDTTTAGIERIRQLYGDEGVRQRTIPVFEKGLKELYTIDPRAARQLAQTPELELKAIADWVLLPSRLLRGGATSLNAAFAVPNFIRDQISSAIISKNARATHNPIAFWAGFKEAILKPTGRATLGRVPGVSGELFEPSALFKEYLARNGNMTSVDLARNLKGATRQAQENLGVRGEGLLRRYENIISASEKATRYQNFIGTYRKALKNNVNAEQAIEQASRAARTNSINFSTRGELATFMKIFNPYFNASVQGSSTLLRAFGRRPVMTSLKVGSTILAPVATATYHNLSDPERAELYARIPDYERRDNLIMVLGGNRGYIKVPLPPGMREFANPLRNYIEAEYLGDRQGLLETAKNLLVDPFSPVGTTANELISQAVPQGVRPAIELGMNRELYTGRDIVPENLQGLPAEEQVFDSTPQAYRDIGKLLGVSPLQVRKVVTGYGAGGLEGAIASADFARGKESGKRSTVEQIIRRFYGTPPSDTSNQVRSTFYETYTPLRSKKENLSKKVTEAVKQNDMTTANRLANQINDEIEREKRRLQETYGRFETDLTVLFDQFDSLKLPVENGKLTESSIRARRK